ncbi:MAG: Hpt domain-containing protein, partial [Clostridiales bacterium]|nr:Hpt domain-containing protein [Clostridiales bacterium]
SKAKEEMAGLVKDAKASTTPILEDGDDFMQGDLISKEAGIRNCADAEDLYNEMLSEFIAEHSNDISKIESARAKDDLLTAQRLAHTLKSSSTLVGALKLSAEAFAMEKDISSNRRMPTDEDLQRLETVLEQSLAVIREMAATV